ncbi:MAG: hypothetical protein WCO96_01815 [Actinomycetes bacterium]
MGKRGLATFGILVTAAVLPASGSAATQSVSPKCDLVRSAQAEFGSCVLVTASVSKAPKVGETGTVTVKFRAATGISGNAKVRIEATPNIALRTLPSGFKASSAMTSSLGMVGQRATSTVTLSSGATATRTFTFRPAAAGYGNVRVTADSPVDVTGSGGSADAVFLTFDSKSGKVGLPARLDGSARVLPKGTRVTVPQYSKLNKEAPGLTDEEIQIRDGTWPDGGQGQGQQLRSSRASRRAHSAAAACVTGRIALPNLTMDSGPGVAVAAENIPVQAWDANSSVLPIGGAADLPLALGRTAADGSFRLCFDNRERGVFFGTGNADVYVKWKLDTANYMVGSRQMFGDTEMDVGSPWEWRTATVDDAPAGDRDLGILTVSDPLQVGAVQLFQMAGKAWARTPGPCWDQDGGCDRKKIAWSPDSRTWPHYSPFPYATIQLPWEAAFSETTVFHELGHAVMADVFDITTDDMLAALDKLCPSPHNATTPESAACAWAEGFATWYADHVLDHPDGGGFSYANAARRLNEDLERANWTWGVDQGWLVGDHAELRVASALWDIEDGLGQPDRDPYDVTDRQFDRIWTAFQAGKSWSFREFVDRLGDAGLGLNYSLLSTLYGATIDYANPFREDLWVNRVISLGEGSTSGWGWGGPHVVEPKSDEAITSGHRYRLVRPLTSPASTRSYVLAVRSKGPRWAGPLLVNYSVNETLPRAISGQRGGPYGWTWSTFSLGARTFSPRDMTSAATVIPSSSFDRYAYAILPFNGSNSPESMALRPGYEIEMTDVAPLERYDGGGAGDPRLGSVTYPKGAVARAGSFPLTAGRAIKVHLAGCTSLNDLTNIGLTMMDTNPVIAKTANRMQGWIAPPSDATFYSPLTGGAATSLLTVNPRVATIRGTKQKLVWFRPTVTTTGVLLLSLPADTSTSTRTRCVRVVTSA